VAPLILNLGSGSGLANFNAQIKAKGKAVPLQACSGPESSRKLRFPDYMMTQDGGKAVSPTHRPPLPPGNAPGISVGG